MTAKDYSEAFWEHVRANDPTSKSSAPERPALTDEQIRRAIASVIQKRLP